MRAKTLRCAMEGQLMRPQRLCVLVAPLTLLASAASAEQPQIVQAGSTDQGELSLNVETKHNHHGHGYQRVAAMLHLHQPQVQEGRSVTRYELTQDWDCAKRRVRTVRLVRRDWTGGYAGGEFRDEPWRAVPDAGGEARAWEVVCPAEAAALKRSTAARVTAQRGAETDPAQTIMPKRSRP